MRTGSVAPNSEIAQAGSIVFSPKRMPVCRYVNILSKKSVSLLDILQVVADNIKLLIVGPLLVGVLALRVSFLIPPSYTAVTQFLPPQQQQSAAASMLAGLGSLGGLAGAASGLKNPADQYVAFLKSQTLQSALIDEFKLMDYYESTLKADALASLNANTRVNAGKDGLIKIEFDDKNPELSAKIANAYVDQLRLLLGRLVVTEAQNRRIFFEKQLQETKRNMIAAEQALQAGGVDARSLKMKPEAAIEGLAKLQAQVAAQEVKVASMRGYLTEQAPEFKQAILELSALRSQLARIEGNKNTSIQNDDGYIARFREFKYHETLFDLFAKQYELAKIDEAREGAVIQVLDVAVTPEKKSKPKKALIAVMATLATGFVLLTFVFVRQSLRNASQDLETAAKLSRIRQSLLGH